MACLIMKFKCMPAYYEEEKKDTTTTKSDDKNYKHNMKDCASNFKHLRLFINTLIRTGIFYDTRYFFSVM